MTPQSTKRKPAKKQADKGSISVGDVSGIGNVVGHDSHSEVNLSGEGKAVARSLQKPAHKSSRQRTLWARLAAFLLALAGTLLVIVLFVRLLQGIDAWTIVELVLAAIVAALGISGTIKPQAVADIFAKLAGKG